MWRKGNPCALLLGTQTGAAAVESSMEIPQEITNRTASRASNSTSGEFIRRNTNGKEQVHPYVHCSIIYNTQDVEAAQVPISR